MLRSLLDKSKILLATALIVSAQLIQVVTPLIPAARAADTSYPTPLPGSTPVTEVQVCHANNNNKDPYGVVLVSVSAADPTAGHGGHTGPVWNPDLKGGPNSTAWGDIIPPFYYVGADGTVQYFAGQNWNPDSQMIWQYGCNPNNIPPEAMAPKVTVTPIACVAGTDSVDTFTVAIVNTNDPFNETVTYTVKVKNSAGTVVTTQTLTLQDEWIPNATNTGLVNGNPYQGTLTFTGLAAGTYSVEITGSETLPSTTYATNITRSVTLNQCHEITTVTPVAPVIAANPCGTVDDTFTWTPITGVAYTYTDVDGTVKTLSAPTGTIVAPVHYTGGTTLTISAHVTDATLYQFTPGATTTWNLLFTNVACPAVVPVGPAVLETCGPNNDTVTPTAYDAATVDHVETSGWTNNTYTVTYYAKAGYSFGTNADGTPIMTKVYTVTDKASLCPAPKFTQATCTDRTASVTLEALEEGYFYTVSVNGGTPTVYTPLVDQTITFTTLPLSVTVKLYQGAPNSVVPATLLGTYPKAFVIPQCPIDIPTPPATTDPCGAANVSWVKPEGVTGNTWTDEAGFIWTINADNSLTVTTPANYFFNLPNETKASQYTFDAPKDANVLCAPTGTPTVQVYCGTINNDSAVLPDVAEGAHYTWSVSYDDATGTITVTAVADEGYTFEEGVQTVWTFVDAHTACPAPVFTPTDCITATGSVTATFDTETYAYTVSGPGLTGEVSLTSGVAMQLPSAGAYTIHAYLYDGEDMVATETWTHTYPVLNCTPGKGEVPPAPVLPAELPHTGPSDASSPQGLFLALIAAVATYGAVYFAQGRQRFEI